MAEVEPALPREPDQPQDMDQDEEQHSEISTAEPFGPGALPSQPSELPSGEQSRQVSTQPIESRRPSIVRIDEARDGIMSFGPIRDGVSIPPPLPYPSPPQGVPSWPRPSNNLYLEVSAEPTCNTPVWILDRPTGRYTMKPPSTSKFKIDQAEGVFNVTDKCI